MAEYYVIGKNTPRIDSPVKVTGQALYAGDITLPNFLYGKILRSPYPHAKLLNIDPGKAKRQIGVKAAVIGKDTAGIKYGVLERTPRYMNEHLITIDKARYAGDEIAAVAAIDEDLAQEALELIEVDYEVLPGVFDPEEAMKPEVPLIHEEWENNIGIKVFWTLGNVDEGFREAYHIREDKFETQSVLHCPMEPHTALANYDSSGKLTVWTSTQVPFYVHRGLSRTLPMPEGSIRVIKPHVGGGFGGKWEMCSIDFCASFLSIKTGRPVKIAYTREEEFFATHRRHPEVLYFRTGVKKDGSIVARESKVILDGGAYFACGHITTFLSGSFQTTPYRIPNYKYEGIRIFTNKAPCGAMRGHGGVQPHTLGDFQLDKIAEDLGIDPIEIRIRNSLQIGDTTLTNYKIVSCGLPEALRKGSEEVKFKEKREKEDGKGAGVGASGFISGESVHIICSVDAYSAATMKLQEDGTALLLTGASDIGQGSDTVLAMIAAEELGLSLKDIKITSADTELTPLDMGSYSSRVTLFAGNAVKNAASELKKKLLEIAAEELEASPEDLELKDKRIFVKGSPEKGISFVQAVSIAQRTQRGKPLTATGSYTPPFIEDISKVSKPMMSEEEMFNIPVSPTFSFGAHFAEVEVDKDTGKMAVNNFLAAHDCGFALNPMAVEGQLQGSVHMGLGYALTEELLMEEGRPLNPSFLEYKILTAMDIPMTRTLLIEPVDPEGPFGAKESSEGTLNPTPAAVANAIYNAIGVRVKGLPIWPEKILSLMEEKG